MKKTSKLQGKVRIIGGTLRGRKIPIPNAPSLRPTPDRVRETLFNWLSPYLEDATVLECFAGSGVLGFEALSRGARHATFIDSERLVVSHLHEIASAFNYDADMVTIVQGTIPRVPASKIIEKPVEIVFVDPPFTEANLIQDAYHWLTENDLLADGAYIYVESKAASTENIFAENMALIKDKVAANVRYQLYQA